MEHGRRKKGKTLETGNIAAGGKSNGGEEKYKIGKLHKNIILDRGK